MRLADGVDVGEVHELDLTLWGERAGSAVSTEQHVPGREHKLFSGL